MNDILQDAPYAALSEAVYQEEGAPPGWKREQTESWSSGLFAAVFVPVGTGRPVIAFRGTDEKHDWAANLHNCILGIQINQYQQAVDFTERVRKRYANCLVTGHSLGGGLAQYASAKCKVEGVTFNPSALGIWSGVSQTFGLDSAAPVRNYVYAGEPVSLVNALTSEMPPSLRDQFTMSVDMGLVRLIGGQGTSAPVIVRANPLLKPTGLALRMPRIWGTAPLLGKTYYIEESDLQKGLSAHGIAAVIRALQHTLEIEEACAAEVAKLEGTPIVKSTASVNQAVALPSEVMSPEALGQLALQAYNNADEAAKALKQWGGRPLKDTNGDNPLHHLVRQFSSFPLPWKNTEQKDQLSKAIALFGSNGARNTDLDHNGQTPLHLAVNQSSPDPWMIVALLDEASPPGVPVKIVLATKNKDGESVFARNRAWENIVNDPGGDRLVAWARSRRNRTSEILRSAENNDALPADVRNAAYLCR